MSPLLAAELLKLRTTRAAAGLVGGAALLVVTAVVLHGYGLPAENLARPDGQLTFLVGWGEVLGALFAALLGALSVTTELRHGTIRPTLLVTPRRNQVVAAKAVAVAVVGASLGLVATASAAVTGRITLAAKGLDVTVTGADWLQLIVGGALAAALWAVIGLGVGALIRRQVPTVVGLLAWVLFVEGLLLDNAPAVGRYAPGALGQAISGLRPDSLLTPTVGAVVLTGYAAVCITAGTAAINRQDVT